MIDENTHKATLKYIRDTLVTVLGSDLGEFEVLNKSGAVVSEIPAITIEYPPLPNSYRMKENSGVEAVINRNPEISLDTTLGGYSMTRDYCISLFQHDLSRSLVTPIEKIIACNKWEIIASPIILDNIETPIGRIKPQAKIKLHVSYHLAL